MKTIFLCADDFGLNSEVSEGILDLVRAQRLSAVSCMTNMADFNSSAKQLCQFNHLVKLGLHFNLTEGFLGTGLQTNTLSALLLKSHLRWLDKKRIADELQWQLQQFVTMMGRLPDFIDGHQHIHQFPIIRDIILELYGRELKKQDASIRVTWPVKNGSHDFKAAVLGWTGGRALRHLVTQQKIPTNSYFSGIYDFSDKIDYRRLFQHWLSLAQDNTLIMCHPGKKNKDDRIAKARLLEFHYLMSDDFLKDCETFQVILSQNGPAIINLDSD